VNLQANGDIFVGSFTTTRQVSGLGTQVEIDLSHVPPGRLAVLYFDLLGFGAHNSRVILDDIVLLGVDDVPPVANPDQETVDVDKSIKIEVLANDNDPDGQLVPSTVVITSGPTHGHVSVNTTTGVVTYTPDLHYEGQDEFTYRVQDNDGFESADARVTIHITQINEAPVSVRLTTQRVRENESAAVVGTFQVDDPDHGDTHTFVVDDSRFEVIGNELRLRAGVTLNHEATPTIMLAITATDRGGLAIDRLFDVQVENVNEPPRLTDLPPIELLEDHSLTAGAYDLWLFASDPESSNQLLTFTLDPTRPAIFGASVQGNRYLILSPGENEFGSGQLQVRVSDGEFAESRSLSVQVKAVNDAPRFTPGSSIRVAEDSGNYRVKWASQIVAGPTNESSQTWEFQVHTTNPSLFSSLPQLNTEGFLVFTPAAHAHGQTDVRIQLRDNGGILDGGRDTSDEVTLTIELTPVNDPPTLSNIPAIQLVEDGTPATIQLSAYYADVETPSRDARYTIESSSSGLVVTLDATSQRLTITGRAHFSGSGSVTIRVTDTGDGNDPSQYAESLIPVTIRAVADPPQLNVSDRSGKENQPIAIDVSTTLLDADSSETLSLILRGLPASAIVSTASRMANGDWLFNATSNPLQNFTVTVDDDGDFSLTWIATATETSNGDQASREVSSWLRVANVAPTAEFSNTGHVTEGSVGGVLFRAVSDPSPADTQAGFRYSYDWNNDGQFEIVNSLLTDVTVPAAYLVDGPGERVVRGRVIDQDGGYTDYTTTITITNAVPNPQIVGVRSGWDGMPMRLTGSATDPGGSGENVAFSWSVRRDGQTIFSGTGDSLSFVPDRNGTYRVQLSATDKDDGRGTTEADLTVAAIDLGDAPDSYHTSLAKNGARHALGSPLFLGRHVDAEQDATPGSSAQGDDHDASLDDEDGVRLVTSLRPGEQATVVVIASAPGRLQAFLDFNRDGSFAGVGEQILRNVAVVAGENRFTFPVPTVTCIDCGCGGFTTYARFRVSSSMDLSFDGMATDGEVEDYLVTIGTSVMASPVAPYRYQLDVAPATPGGTVTFVYSTQLGTHRVPQFGVTLCLTGPTFFAQGVVDTTGRATVLLELPKHLLGQTVYVQAFEQATRPSISPVMTFQVPPSSWLDVNRDGHTTPLDALVIINHLIRTTLERTTTQPTLSADFLLRGDVNRDGGITPHDALLVINQLNAIRTANRSSFVTADGEGEGSEPVLISASSITVPPTWTHQADDSGLHWTFALSTEPKRSHADQQKHLSRFTGWNRSVTQPHGNSDALISSRSGASQRKQHTDRDQLFGGLSADDNSWLNQPELEADEAWCVDESVVDMLARQIQS